MDVSLPSFNPPKRKLTDDDDKHRKRLPVPQVGILKRIGDNVVTRRCVLPLIRWCWPCTPQKIKRNALVVLSLIVLLFLCLECFGRLRFRGHFVPSSDGNGLMGLYHEMDIDMEALRSDSDRNLYPVNAINQREVKAWIHERRRRTNGRKFLVGCSADWKGYVLRSFLHLFQGLKSDHGWTDLITDSPLEFFYKQDASKAPSVLFFCLNSFRYPFYLFLEHNHYFQELRALGTLIVVWSDDLQYFDQFHAITIREKILKRSDLLVGSYSYLTDDYFKSITRHMNPRDLPVLLWLPHSAGPDFIHGGLNPHPIHKILLSGKLGATWYPLRHWLGEYQKTHPTIMDVYQHSGYYVADNQTEIYASYLRAYRIGITTTLIHQFLIAKVFEIPSTGALLLMNQDLSPLLTALGMKEMEHYVTFDRTNPEPMLWWVYDPLNQNKIDDMRKKGMELVREKHLVTHRVMALEQFLSDGIITYEYPLNFFVHSPCPMIAISSTSQCENSFQWNARYKCDLWFCGIRSIYELVF